MRALKRQAYITVQNMKQYLSKDNYRTTQTGPGFQIRAFSSRSVFTFSSLSSHTAPRRSLQRQAFLRVQ